MTAILEALKALPDGASARVYSDSELCVKGLTVWREAWIRTNWRKRSKDMPNRDLWLALETQLSRVNAEFLWVRGHDGNVGNEEADRLATEGLLKALETV